METTTATQTATDLRAAADQHERDAIDSFDRCDTDGFVSQWASGIMAQVDRLQADIVENGGVATFPALYVVDTDERVPAKLIDGKFGRCWAIVDEAGRFTGEFVSAFPKRESTMARKGYREGSEVAPAKAAVHGSGHGLSGSAWAAVERTDDGTGRDERVVPVTMAEEAAADAEELPCEHCPYLAPVGECEVCDAAR